MNFYIIEFIYRNEFYSQYWNYKFQTKNNNPKFHHLNPTMNILNFLTTIIFLGIYFSFGFN